MEVELLKYLGNFGFSAIIAFYLLWMIRAELKDIKNTLTINAQMAHKGDQQLINIVFKQENRLRYVENCVDDINSKLGMQRRRDHDSTRNN